MSAFRREMRGHYIEGVAWMAGLSAAFWMLTTWLPAVLYAFGAEVR